MDLSREVQQFLTRMRDCLTPEAAGVTVFGGVRRVPGLRREEVAQLAGVSTAYYTRIERGNLRGVSDSVLRSLARALHMNAVETEHLFDLAHAASAGARTSQIEPESRLPHRAAQLIDAMPDLPIVALGRLSDVLGANELGRALFPHLFPDDGEPLNHSRYLFLDDRAREFYVDWEHDARHVVSVLRLEAGRRAADQSLATLVDELSAGSPEFRTWWAGHTVDVHTDGTKRIRHPVVGELTVAYERLGLASTPDVHLAGYLTDPGTPSAHALDLLRDRCPGTGTVPSTRTATAPSFVADIEAKPMPPHRFPALGETGRTRTLTAMARTRRGKPGVPTGPRPSG